MPAQVLSLTGDLPRIAARLRKEFDDGLLPLFVIGAGVSNSEQVARVPTFETMLDRLRKFVEGVTSAASPGADRSLQELARLFQGQGDVGWDDSVVVTRILMEAQESRSPAVQDCWRKFSQWLLWDCLIYPETHSSKEPRGILHADPTPAHQALAELYKEIGALVVSLNFDGLTRKALRTAGFHRALILNTPDRVERFFCRGQGESPQREDQMVAVVKLRGDAFMAACQRDGCPLHNHAIPLWDLGERARENREESLKCQACRHARQIGISFPGVPDKEAATQQMLLSLLKYLSIRVGSIFVIGLSGRWDHTVSTFISTLARTRHVPTCVVRRHPDHDRVFRGTILSARRESDQDSGYFAATADDFFGNLIRAVKAESRPVFATVGSAQRRDPGISDDRFWSEELDKDASDATTGSSIGGLELTELEKRIIGHEHFSRLANIAQLGLKNYWLGVKRYDTINKHNRKVHSLGTTRVASALYLSLRDHRHNPATNSRRISESRPERELYLLRLGALLHDIGHMPFSHMLEEVFEELNWVLDGDIRAFRHTDYTSKLVEEICAAPGISSLLASEYGYTSRQVIGLINGSFGVHYLDALIDSPVDADKIDYVFRDSKVCVQHTTLPAAGQWLRRLLRSEDLAVSPEGFLKLGGEAASSYLHLLEARQHLYESFYLSPLIRFPEALMRFLLVLSLTSRITPDRLRFDPESLMAPGRDLGRAKILAAQQYLFERAEEIRADASQYEFKIAQQIIGDLKTSYLHPLILDALPYTTEVIEVNDKNALERKYAERILGEPLLLRPGVNVEDVRKCARDTMLRKPGAIVVDIVRPTSFLSSSRRRRVRGSGRATYEQDCVLAPEQNPRYWKAGDPAVKPLSTVLRAFARESERAARVSIFKIAPNDNYARQARDLFLSRLRSEDLL